LREILKVGRPERRAWINVLPWLLPALNTTAIAVVLYAGAAAIAGRVTHASLPVGLVTSTIGLSVCSLLMGVPAHLYLADDEKPPPMRTPICAIVFGLFAVGAAVATVYQTLGSSTA
jgi:hypothetical protein